MVRHAKAEKLMPGLEDIDRPLHVIGVEESYRMAREIKKDIPQETHLVTSPAMRATGTALIFRRVLNIAPGHFSLIPDLYEAGVNTICDCIYKLNPGISSVMLFGHNPAFSEFAYLIDRSINHMPTGSVTKIEYPAGSWTDFSFDLSKVVRFIHP